MIERDEEEEEVGVKKTEDNELDVDDLKKRLNNLKKQQSYSGYQTQIIVNLGNEEYDVGKSKIT